MANYTAASLKAELNSKGWRMTPQREKILHVFQNLPKGNHSCFSRKERRSY